MEESRDKIRRIVTAAVSQAINGKPEHMTHLRGEELVFKDHPRIAFRGAIDSLESEIILFQTLTEKKQLHRIWKKLSRPYGGLSGVKSQESRWVKY